MADDIDIEEHDILDNPRIQDILHIKEEPIDLDSDSYEEPAPAFEEYHEYNPYQQEKYDDQHQNDNQIPQYIQEPHENDETPYKEEETQEIETPDMVFNDEDIELSAQDEDFNNPDADFNESVLESETETEYIPDLSNDIYHHNNKIILGTKPCIRPIRDVNAAYVDLEDWGIRLENSVCYCKECQTLYATRNALDAHNMIAHSFLIALDSPESSESETRAAPEKTETAKYCDHCKKYFPSDHALIQHLYDLITANKPAPTPPKPTPNTQKLPPAAIPPPPAQNTPPPTQPTVKYKDCTNTGQHMVYSCLICNSAYLDPKWFKSHYRTVHSHTELGKFEYIPFTGLCKICNRTYSSLKRFNVHVKVHIEKQEYLKPQESVTESLETSMNVESQAEDSKSESVDVDTQAENEESKSEDEISEPESTAPLSAVTGTSSKTKRSLKSNYQCIKCKTFYTTIRSIGHHQRKYHSGEKIIKKLAPKCATPILQKMLQSSFISDTIQFSDSLVPKSSVFKCNTCKIHFVTCWSAILHTCVEFISRYQCDICCKEFCLKDMETHHQQHKYNDAFNTYYISKDMNTKMMFWCQKCAVYFELRKIKNHLSICKGTSSSVRCKLCEIDVSDILTHMHHHKLHSSKSDFIFIDDLLPRRINDEVSQEKDLKRKLPMDSEPGATKVKKLDANQFRYCDLCRTCMKSSGGVFHTTGECKKNLSKCNCEFCGLVFFSGAPTNYHEEYHRRTNANIKDFTFVHVTDQTPIVPVIPEFPKCDSCSTHDFVAHECGSSKTCKICNKKFSESAYKLHVIHHKYLKEDTEVDELIKKYETLTSTWNILYLCVTCNVATDSYDDVVVHCQNHYNNKQECAARNCDSCSLKFEESCFKRHKELHSPSITKESFKTVVYDYKNLLNDDWLKLFGNLSKAEVYQIVTRSIYVTRFVKMKLILDGPPELTIYKCETCKLYVDPHAIYNHTTQCVTAQDHNKKSYTCETCLIPFSTAMVRKDHEKLHMTPNITANSFRIVAFNDKSDRNFNTNLQVDADALEFQPKTPINVHPTNIKSNTPKTVLIYQCRQCKCSSHNAESLIRHKCLLDKELVKCNKCKIDISLSHLKDHRKWHKQNTNITRHNIKHVFIDNKVLAKRKYAGDASDKIKKPTYKLHQCKKCKVCYSFWVKHLSCSMKYRKCKKCGYLFSYSSYVTHNLWHEQNVNATRSDIKVVTLTNEQSSKSKIEKWRFIKAMKLSKAERTVEMPPPPPTSKVDLKITLYQCYNCKLCSSGVAFVKKHTVCSSSKKGKYHCKICDLKFKFYGMRYHRNWHRDNKSATKKHIKILPFKGMKILKNKDGTAKDSKKKDGSSNIVSDYDGYHCKKCGASSKKTIFFKKHKCKSSPEKSKASPYLYYQCKDCSACSTSKRHYCIPSHRIRVCPKCKLKFSDRSIYDHMQKHAANKDMTRSKIKVIAFRKFIDKTNSAEPSASKPEQKVSTVYRCSCGLHFISQKTIERHFTVCSPDHDIPSENCSKCGLLFPTNHLVSHLCNHHSYGKGNIEVKTIPTVTHYRCGSCKFLFTNESRVLKHNKRCDPDNDKSVRCDECDLDFHESDIKLHKESHKTSSDLNKPCRIVTVNKYSRNLDVKKQKRSNESEDEANVSELDGNISQGVANGSYSQFGVEYDNYLFKCRDCDTHYLKLDSFLRHFQRKNCVVENKPACPHCGLCFTKLSLTKHIHIHHEKFKLKLEDFVINIGDSNTDTRYTKAALIKHKHPPVLVNITPAPANITDDNFDDTLIDLYKCHICNAHFLHPISLRNHIYAQTHSLTKINCSQCGLIFTEKAIDMHLKIHHKKRKLGRQDFRIVERRDFVSKAKKLAKKAEIEYKVKNEHVNLTSDDVDEPSETSAVENETNDIIYYNCVKCNLHFMSLRSLGMHFDESHKVKTVETCVLCNLSFTSLIKHRMHHNRPSFSILDINDESDCVNKLFKCQECGVHFMKPLDLLNHINKREQIHAGRRLNWNCPQCGLIFAPRTLKVHQKQHHGDHSLRLEDLVIDTSIGKYRTHKSGIDDNITITQSSAEDLTTDPNESMNKTLDVLETNDPEIKSTNKSPDNSTKLYKCGKCNVYFLTQATCYRHIVKHIPMDPKEYIECKLCSFQFRIVSLNTHIRKHHKTDFAFEKVLIEEYQPKRDDEKVPKIDIYYAKDKVQSRLISTTTDDSVDNSAEISQSEIDCMDDPEASNDSNKTVKLASTVSLNTEIELDSSNAMVESPTFTDIKEENDSFGELFDKEPKENEGVQKPAEISQSEIDPMDDPAASNDSNKTVKLSNSNSFNTEIELDSRNAIATPAFTDIKEENDSFEEPKENESVRKSNKCADNLDKTPSIDAELFKKDYSCGYCSETFVSKRAKDFHENLDHLDALKDCPICKKSFHTSVLNILHLEIKNDIFVCCICSQSANVNMLPHHSFIHKHLC